MTSKEINEYYDVTADREIRPSLLQAIRLVGKDRIAIDCGCGAGKDIEYLRGNNFVVHAFDLEAESINRCRERFKTDEKVFLSQASFTSYSYPSASLILADASLFFCPRAEFDLAWRKIIESLIPGGIFVGSFLGPNDTMAGPDYDKEAFWPDVLVFNEDELKSKFRQFEIATWDELETSGKTAQGEPHHWHIFSVIAKKHPG
jgi:SAM-dependent methyltransferase